jgi:7 transmembrane receptor (rhodopsin family)
MITEHSTAKFAISTDVDSRLTNESNITNFVSSSNSGLFTFWTPLNILTFIIGLVGIAGNLFACVIIGGYKPLRKRIPNYYLLNQSILDLLAGLVLTIGTVLSYYKLTGTLYYAFCYMIKARLIFLSLFMASTWNLAALSYERYTEIVNPIRHKLSLTKTKVILTCIAVWLIGLVSKVIGIVNTTIIVDETCKTGFYGDYGAKFSLGLFIFGGEFFIPLCIIAACYNRTLKAVRQFSFASTSGTESKSQMIRARKNIIKLLAIIVVAFVLTVAPRHFMLLLTTVGMYYIDLNSTPFVASVVLNYSNCCIKPLIYFFKYEEFQKGLKCLVRCKATPILTPIEVVDTVSRKIKINEPSISLEAGTL